MLFTGHFAVLVLSPVTDQFKKFRNQETILRTREHYKLQFATLMALAGSGAHRMPKKLFQDRISIKEMPDMGYDSGPLAFQFVLLATKLSCYVRL